MLIRLISIFVEPFILSLLTYIKRLLLLFCFLLQGDLLHAQFSDPYNFKFKFYNTQNGLVHDYVKKCLMDAKGYLWVITNYGVSRFDGYSFKNYTNSKNSAHFLPFAEALDLAIDSKDNVWFTANKKLYRLDPVHDVFTEIDDAGQHRPKYKITYDRVNKRMLVTNWDGYFIINEQTLEQKFVDFQEPESRRSEMESNYLLLDSKQRLWIPYSRYAYHCIDLHNNKQYKYKQDFWPVGFYEDDQGTIYANVWQGDVQRVEINANDHKLVSLPVNAPGIFKHIVFGSCNAHKLTGSTILWLALSEHGLMLFDTKQNKIIQRIKYNPEKLDGLPSNELFNIYEDKFGNIWIASWKGLIKVGVNEQQFKSERLPIFTTTFYNLISGFCDDQRNPNLLWASTGGAGLWKIDKTKNKIIERYYYDALSESEDKNYLWRWNDHMHVDSQKSTWCSTYGGVVRQQAGQVSHINLIVGGKWPFVKSFCEWNNERMFILSHNGMFEYNRLNKKIIHHAVPDTPAYKMNQLNCAVKISGEELFVGSAYGYYIYNVLNGKFRFKRFNFHDSLADKLNQCRQLIKSASKIYAATAGGVIAYDLVSNTYEIIGREQGIDEVYLSNMLLDENSSLWIYNYHNLYQYSTKNKTIQVYDKTDGIYGFQKDPAIFFKYNNQFCIGYRGAITYFDPAKVSKALPAQSPQINSFWVNKVQHKIDFDSFQTINYQLNYKQNEWQFDLTSISYDFSDKISFEVWLEGFDRQWRHLLNTRSVSYNNLSPGKYTFKVRCANRANEFNPVVREFKLHIRPAFWQTWWFKLLSVFLAALLLYSFYRWRVQNVNRINEEREKNQALQLSQYQKEIKLQKIVNFFSTSLIHNNNIDEVLWQISKDLISQLDFEDCMIYLWDDKKEVLIQKAGYGQKGDMNTVAEKEKYNIKKGQGIIGAAAELNEALLINDTSKDERYRIVDGLSRYSELCVPIIKENEQIGIINAEASQRNFFDAWHVQMLNTIAALIADKIKAIEAGEALKDKQLELASAQTKIVETELSLLRSQMNPHFIFNSLHSIHNYIWDNRQEDAAEYLVKFSKLIRRILELSSEKYISLADELETLKLYIELEHRRSNAKFSYQLQYAQIQNSQSIKVPPMIFQPFAENAIWHGLNNLLDNSGELNISLRTDDTYLYCDIGDNGIGRAKANELSAQKLVQKKSMGIDITKKRIEQFGAGQSGRVEIVDLPQGTLVKIKLPLIYE